MYNLIGRDSSSRFYIIELRQGKHRKFDQLSSVKALAAPLELVQALKSDMITQDEYNRRYSAYLKNPIAQALLEFMIQQARVIHVYLVIDQPDLEILQHIIGQVCAHNLT